MLTIGALGFATPWVLAGLLALPIVWFLLRVVPPAPLRQRFPAVVLLLGLEDKRAQSDRTPWWVLLLRILVLAALIIAFSGPVWQPQRGQSSSQPLLVVIDGSWADAGDWSERLERAKLELDQALAGGRPVAVLRLTDPAHEPQFQNASDWAERLGAMQPQPWNVQDLAKWTEKVQQISDPQDFDTVWFSNGLADEGRAQLAQSLMQHGSLRVIQGEGEVLALHPASLEDGRLDVVVSRLTGLAPQVVEVAAFGPDPAGIERELGRTKAQFDAGQTQVKAPLDLPVELRNRLTRFEIIGQLSVGARSLTGDQLKRPKVALVHYGAANEGLQLLSPLHYLREALRPGADLVEGAVSDVLQTAPDVLVLADVARLTVPEQAAVQAWVEKGGLLLRFAGPKLASSDRSVLEDDPLLPVPLREGGRNMGGAMSWGQPKTLAPFPEDGPFYGLSVPDEVEISAQVLAQPDPELSRKTIAMLEDGTPLVTRKALGEGQVVLFHVTANADWSSLPLSGVFVQMLERLAVTRMALTDLNPEQEQSLSVQTFSADQLLDVWGERRDGSSLSGVPGEDMLRALQDGPNASVPPGLYAGQDRRIALNLISQNRVLEPALWPAGVQLETMQKPRGIDLQMPLLVAALSLFLIDMMTSLYLAGRLKFGRSTLGVILGAIVVMSGSDPVFAQAAREPLPPQVEDFALRGTQGVVLAYVKSGDAALDEISQAGLDGLSLHLSQRSAIEPDRAMAVDIEADDLSFFPFLYWPIKASAELPSQQAYDKLNQFLRTGGMILFDTRDGDLAGSASAESAYLQKLATGLDIPALEQIPEDHVLTRSFYLLQDFPGRQRGGALWVEAADLQTEVEDGMPFRHSNDGVSPVVIGGNDWAAAWALDDSEVPMLPVGRGAAGDRQREIAYRFGVNLIMYVLTGNYKSDQVHVPALLERLGQ